MGDRAVAADDMEGDGLAVDVGEAALIGGLDFLCMQWGPLPWIITLVNSCLR